MNSDFKDLLKIFGEKKVKYLVVGGYAVMRYTEPRYTKDLDVLVCRTKENAEKVYKGLSEFGAPLTDVTVDDLTNEGVFYQIGVAPNRIDIITSIPGIDFDQAFTRHETVKIDSVIALFISREDLIQAKLAAGRPQDLVDAGSLAKSKAKKKL